MACLATARKEGRYSKQPNHGVESHRGWGALHTCASMLLTTPSQIPFPCYPQGFFSCAWMTGKFGCMRTSSSDLCDWGHFSYHQLYFRAAWWHRSNIHFGPHLSRLHLRNEALHIKRHHCLGFGIAAPVCCAGTGTPVRIECAHCRERFYSLPSDPFSWNSKKA